MENVLEEDNISRQYPERGLIGFFSKPTTFLLFFLWRVRKFFMGIDSFLLKNYIFVIDGVQDKSESNFRSQYPKNWNFVGKEKSYKNLRAKHTVWAWKNHLVIQADNFSKKWEDNSNRNISWNSSKKKIVSMAEGIASWVVRMVTRVQTCFVTLLFRLK